MCGTMFSKPRFEVTCERVLPRASPGPVVPQQDCSKPTYGVFTFGSSVLRSVVLLAILRLNDGPTDSAQDPLFTPPMISTAGCTFPQVPSYADALCY